jgi:hypothetical protein
MLLLAVLVLLVPSFPQIERPLSRQDFSKLISKTLGLKLPSNVMDVLMCVFGDEQGRLDGTEFVQVMKRRNKVPGYKVSYCCCCCCLWFWGARGYRPFEFFMQLHARHRIGVLADMLGPA